MLNVYLNLIDNEEKKKFFEKLYETYQKQLLKIAYSILNNPHDAEIVVHNIFYDIATSQTTKMNKTQKIIFIIQLKLFL